MNPSDDMTADFLKRAQLEQQKLDAANASKAAAAHAALTSTGIPGTKTTTGAITPAKVTANTPAQLTTLFNGPFSEGYIMVKVGSDTVAHENLFEERGRFIRRNYPRPVNVTAKFPAKDADVQVTDPNVSRRHAEVRQEGATYWLIDLDSTNGVEVRGKRVKRLKLEDGTRFTIGSTEISFSRELQ
jgi:hypothetical protein